MKLPPRIRPTVATFGVYVTVLVAGLTAAASFAAGADLREAKTLYANASYDEAILELNALRAPEDANEVDQYLALCLIALGRTQEAEQPLEQLVTRDPLYILNQVDTSPKLLDLFHQVRRRILPTAARDAFTQGRVDYEAKHFSTAVEQFKRLIEISNDPDAGDSAGPLKELADGFLALSQAGLAPVAAAAVAAPVSVAAPAAASASVPRAASLDTPDHIYTAADAGVTPPRAINRPLPAWEPADRALARREFRGVLAVVVDEHGGVESASLPAPVTPDYDRALLAAAKQWKFRSAIKDGKPVKYLATIEVLLHPAER